MPFFFILAQSQKTSRQILNFVVYFKEGIVR
nr:MAG TPA: hypothetical protein [Caudoviricetes sp.]